jgi:hypothetical protein
MEVIALRDALPRLRDLVPHIALDDGDLSEVVREDASGQEPGDAAAENDCPLKRTPEPSGVWFC